MTPLDAMKHALDALEIYKVNAYISGISEFAITNLRTAIAEMESDEPVAWWDRINDGGLYGINVGGWCEPLFTHPAQSRNEPNFIDLLKEANEIVKGKSIYKRFMASTPLENDVPVWMADFAMEHGIYQPVEPEQSRDSIIEECAVVCEEVHSRYPTDIFPEGQSVTAQSAKMARITANNCALEIRALKGKK